MSFFDTLDNKHVVEIEDKDDFIDSIPTSFKEALYFFIFACALTNLLEEAEEGVSLNELFENIISQTTNPKTILWLGQLKGYCGISNENPGPSFSYEKAIKDLKVFEAKDLPHLKVKDEPGITNISYDVDCSLSEELDLKNFVATINDLINK